MIPAEMPALRARRLAAFLQCDAAEMLLDVEITGAAGSKAEEQRWGFKHRA